MSTRQEENLRLMQDAEEANAFMGVARPFIDRALNDITAGLVAHYRTAHSAPLSHDFIVGKIAEIAAYHNLVSAMETAHRKGIAAAEEEIDNATQEESRRSARDLGRTVPRRRSANGS